VISRWVWQAGWLLLPVAWLLHRFVHDDAIVFFVACASLIPLAKAMGDATEGLAERMGPAVGSLLNATFGNAAELILGIAALRHGHVDLVKGSITGSILANLLLVGGGSIVTGGIRFSELRFNRLAASSSVSTLFLAVVAMVVPTLLSLGRNPRYDPALLSEEICAVLIAMYALSLWFGLRTHREHMAAVDEGPPAPAKQAGTAHQRPIWYDLGRLLLAAAATAVAVIFAGVLHATWNAMAKATTDRMMTFAAFGVYGLSAITAVTAQNTLGVTASLPLPADLVTAQIEAVASDIECRATKTGMLATAAIGVDLNTVGVGAPDLMRTGVEAVPGVRRVVSAHVHPRIADRDVVDGVGGRGATLKLVLAVVVDQQPLEDQVVTAQLDPG